MRPVRRLAFVAAWLVPLALLFARCDRESPITPTPDCTAAVAPQSFTFDAAGGSGSIGISIDSACAWTAQASDAWLTFSGASAGTGTATIGFNASANPDVTDRMGTLTMAGRTVTVVVRGKVVTPPVTCTYAVSPQMAEYARSGGSGTISVTAPAGCEWTAASRVSWITVTNGATGAGIGSVAYTVNANEDTSSRIGRLTVADLDVTLSQDGNLDACTYSVSQVEFTPCLGSTELATSITTQTSCPWTASPSASWISMLSATSGAGSALIRFGVTSNFDAPRFGQVLVRWPTPTAGQNLRVTQAGCHYAVTRSTFALTAAGGTFNFDVLQESDPNTCGGPLQNGCQWSAVSDASWVMVTSSMPRAGDDRVTFVVLTNPTTAIRTATIVVRDQVVRITQAGQ